MRTVTVSSRSEKAEAIKDVADMESVVDYLGLETQRRGSKVSFLCPAHEDTHFGSCYIMGNDGYKCYACGHHGDAIELVQLVRNCSFDTACDLLGEAFGISFSKEKKKMKPSKKLLSEEKLKLIGLGRESNTEKVYADLYAFPDHAHIAIKDSKKYRVRWEPAFDAENEYDLNILQVVVCKNPLQMLLDENENAYKDLIYRKAIEAADKYRRMLDMAQNPAKYYHDGNIKEFELAYYCSKTAEKIGLNVWRMEMEERIRKCDDLRIEFARSSSNTEKRKTTQRKGRVFGQIKRSGASF